MARRTRRRTPVAKADARTGGQPLTGGGTVPAAIDVALDGAGMNATAQMGPGRPLTPAWGYSTRPRAMDYRPGVNTATSGSRASWGRTNFDVLKGLIDSYDVARIAINHKIDELRSMEPLFSAADGFVGDAGPAVDAARAALEFPDRDHPFDSWLSMWLEGVLRYDAGMLYRRRNYAGELIGLEVVDGTTFTPLVDEHGRKPAAPAPAWYQLIAGQTAKWFTVEDLVPTLFRPQSDSPYGLAPIESVLLSANTDLKFQWHFLQMFTDGSIPGGFIEAPPDVSSPDQVDEWQQYWDSMVMGEQAKLHQLIVVPNGTKVTETRPKAFDKTFPQYLMQRVAAAYGVVPQDLGFVDDVNRANGETQTDIQFRVNTLPWVRFVEGVLTRYLRYDLRLPVQVKLDTGRDVVDRAAEAQAWDIAVKGGAASVDEWRSAVYGLPTDNQRPAPRFIYTAHAGPIPLRSLYAVAGPVDPETGAPTNDVPLDTTPFDGAPGVLPERLPGGPEFKRAPIDPDDPRRPDTEREIPGTDVVAPAVAKGAIPAPRASRENDAQATELASFRRFAKARAKAGRWRDFTFTAVDPTDGHRLNQHARARIRKAAGQVVAAGLAVVAADTGRVLMLQRSMDPADPAAGCWEFPGGHVEDGEDVFDAACREWQEETGLRAPAAEQWGGSWTSPNGVYQGYVYATPTEADVPIFERAAGMNPDDPDGDAIEALAWWDPATLPGNPAVRPELADTLHLALPVIEEATGEFPKGDAADLDDIAVGAPRHHISDGSAGDAELGCDVASRDAGLAKGADAPDLVGVKATDRPGRSGSSPLLPHVADVVVLTAQEEMIRPHAGRVVTPVEYGQSRRDGSVGQLPGEAMRRDGASVAGAEDAVATPVGVRRGGPHPAVPGAVDLLPKAHVSGDRHGPSVLVSKSWRDGPDTHPAHAYDLRITDHYAPAVADALAGLFTSERLAAAVAAGDAASGIVRKDDAGGDDVRDRILDAVGGQLDDAADTSALEAVMRQVIAEAWAAGEHVAAGQLPGGVTVSPSGLSGIDWDRWEPGHLDAAIQAADGRLAVALDDAGIGIKGMVRSTVDRLGERIADGLLDGKSVDSIGRTLRGLLGGDADRAELIAHTETARAMTGASLDVYDAHGIRQWDLVTSAGACPRCMDVAAANPHTGRDDAAPVHPRCRCAVAPHVTY